MSDEAFVVDTNILIYYLDGSIPPENHRIDEIFRSSFEISVITKNEFLGWSGYLDDPDELEAAHAFVENAHVVPLSEDIVDRVIDFRRQHAVPLADGVIGATALHRDATLVTRNTGDFEELPVELYNPFDT